MVIKLKFIRKNIKKVLFTGIIIFLLFLIGITSNERENISGTENIAGVLLSRTQKFVYNIGQTFDNAFISIQSIAKAREENNALRNKISELQQENRTLSDIVYNSQILKAEYKLRMNLEYEYTEAQVVSKLDGNWFDRLVIDKGEKDGIKKNDIVVQASVSDDNIVETGLVGRVVDVGYNWAKIITIIDESSKVSFRVLENNEAGIAEGNIDSTISGYFFNNHSSANEGDKLVTSGLGEIYLQNIYIGSVEKVENTNDAKNFKLYVDPAVDFSKLYKVFVLKAGR